MSEQRFAELYERLTNGKSRKADAEHVFLRGWNAGIDFAILQMRLCCDECVDNETQTTEAAE